MLNLRQAFPAAVPEQQEYDGFEFSWGGSGLAPAIKKRIVQVPIANPVTLKGLIDELNSGVARSDKPPNVCLFKTGLELKPFSRSK